jgi:hypothetical protein
VARGIIRRFTASTASPASSEVAALGHHDRVDDHGGVRGIQDGGDALDRLGGAQHPGLDGVGADVVQHRPRLLFDQVERQGEDAGDAQRILHGDGRDGGRRIGAQHGHGLDVGLDPGPAARVRAGDDQDAAGLPGGFGGHTVLMRQALTRGKRFIYCIIAI